MDHSEIIDQYALLHYGVQGQKWGVQKEAAWSAKADKKWMKAVASPRTTMMVQNTAVALYNQVDLPKINNKPKYKGKDLNDLNSPLVKQCHTDHTNALVTRLDEATKQIFGKSPSGKLSATYGLDTNGRLHYLIYENTVAAHVQSGIQVYPELDDTGHVVSIPLPDPELIMSENASEFLEHHGIKGQKWGVRRSPKQLQRLHPGSEDFNNKVDINTRSKTSGTHTLSNKELETAIRRMNLEQQYSQLSSTKKKSGQGFAGRLLKQQGQQQVNALAAPAVGILAKKAGLVATTLAFAFAH